MIGIYFFVVPAFSSEVAEATAAATTITAKRISASFDIAESRPRQITRFEMKQ